MIREDGYGGGGDACGGWCWRGWKRGVEGMPAFILTGCRHLLAGVWSIFSWVVFVVDVVVPQV